MIFNRGNRLGGKQPRRGGRLTGPSRAAQQGPGWTPVIAIGVSFLLVGIMVGFGWAADRQLRGGLLQQRSDAMQRPDWVALESVPAYVPRAFLTVVDPGFEEGAPVRARDADASVPRSLVRQVHLLNGFAGQARELIMAPVVEQRLTRRQLLETYINRIYLGQANGVPVHGVYYAAAEYMDKPASELTLSEAATLAAILLDPLIEDPAERAGAVGVRRNEVLRAMLRRGDITAAQYQSAVQEELAFQPGLADLPMSRRILTADDTTIVRLPPEYRQLLMPPAETPEEQQ